MLKQLTDTVVGSLVNFRQRLTLLANSNSLMGINFLPSLGEGYARSD